MTAAVLSTLRGQLEWLVKMRRDNLPAPNNYRFACIEDLVLQRGREYIAARSPYEPIPKACFQESYRLATRPQSRWIYVEGYATSSAFGFVTPHAWLTRADQPGHAFDVAWAHDSGLEYLGVPFRAEYVRRIFKAGKRHHYGILEAWWTNYPLVTGEHDIDEAMWKP